jgi:nucleotide-binding universal stress UspA family protein
MKTILVPVDFSTTSVNAARYALKFAKQAGGKLMLLHAFLSPSSLPIHGETQLTEEGLWQMNQEELKKLAAMLSAEENFVKVEYMQLRGTVTEAVTQFEETIQTLIIIMGITGAGKISQTLIGSNTLAVARRTIIPAIIVPEQAEWHPITDVGLTTDFKDVVDTIPENRIKELLALLGARLHVLNVDFQDREWTVDTPFQSGLVESMFERYHPSYHFIQNENIAEGLSAYAIKHGIELLIAIPKKHNLLDRLFSKSYTKELVFHSKVPVLVLHE